MAASFVANFRGVPLSELASQAAPFVLALAPLDPVRAAATYGGLLLERGLQPNCLRLEALVHLCLAHGQGNLSLTSKLFAQGYNDIGEACRLMEDPPEDVFVGNILSTRGNYRVLEGTWESGTFYLQRIVNMVDEISARGALRSFANSIHALLRLADISCDRARLKRHDMGQPEGEDSLPSDLSAASTSLRSLVKFDQEDLHQAGIDIADLAPFVLAGDFKDELLQQSISHTLLERRPICSSGGLLYLVLPTAVSAAVRRFFIDTLGVGPNRDVFVHNLAVEYSFLFGSGPMLGDGMQPFPFQSHPGGSMCCVSKEVDKGRFLNAIFFIDTLDGFDESGLAGAFVGSDDLKQSIEDAVRAMQDSSASQPGFRDGVTLLVGCGIGRGIVMPIDVGRDPKWHFEFLSAPDLCTLSEAREMSPLHLWRINDMQSRLEAMGGHLQNANGLLNLYAWAEAQKGHLVPHSEIPQDALNVKSLNLVISQNSLLHLRHEVASSVDHHVERFVDGRWLNVRTKGRPMFEEDRIDQLYGHFDGSRPRLLGACIGSARCWWYEVTSAQSGAVDLTSQRWEMLGTWMRRAMRPLESAFGNGLREGPVFWHCHFEDAFENTGMFEPGTVEDAVAGISVDVNLSERTVNFKLNRRFDKAIYNVDNVAERALVAELVSGMAKLARTQRTDLESLVNDIVPNAAARQSHIFPVQTFRDHFHDLLTREPVRITSLDDAAAKLGLGWTNRSRDEGGVVEGKAECLAYLSDLVRTLEDALCAELRTYNRSALIGAILFNHEVASVSRERWHRSASAMLALRDNRVATLRGMGEHEFKLNAVFQPSRNLIEMAICESPVDGGIDPGDFDLARLLTKGAELYQLGGWSDLIFWDAMKPSLIIRPYGDVHGHLDFLDTVMDAFGMAACSHRYNDSAKNYSKNVELREAVPESAGSVSQDFLDTWEAEFGVTLDAYRRFIDAVENLAIERSLPLIELRQSELIALADSVGAGELIVENMTLKPRSTWRQLPDGYSPKEIMPWRFRRRLSALRRPVFQLNEANDPVLLVAPGLVREGFAAMVTNYYHAAYPDPHLREPMLRYAGRARERDGLEFNRQTAEEMSSLGWKTELEVKLTKIVGKTLDLNYGDVDVLAWDPKTRRVLIMECKDLQFRKTHGEIAEQVADFRGEIASNGKRDLLRKHLDRLAALRAHREQLARYLRLSEPFTIEGHLVFSHPVPMLFATTGPICEQEGLHVFGELSRLALTA